MPEIRSQGMKTESLIDEQKEHLRQLLGKFSTAMLVTHGSQGSLHARPMALATIDEDCTIWFITQRESAKAHEVESDTRVQIICQKDFSAYISLSGHATLVDDRAKVEEIWKETFKIWFPEGKNDPEIVLISVIPADGEYWDNSGFNKVRYMVESATAYMTGRKPVVKEGREHGVVHM